MQSDGFHCHKLNWTKIIRLRKIINFNALLTFLSVFYQTGAVYMRWNKPPGIIQIYWIYFQLKFNMLPDSIKVLIYIQIKKIILRYEHFLIIWLIVNIWDHRYYHYHVIEKNHEECHIMANWITWQNWMVSNISPRLVMEETNTTSCLIKVLILVTAVSSFVCSMQIYNSFASYTLQQRHNERDVVSNHQPHDCLLKRLFRRTPKKTSQLCVTGLCEGNSPLSGEFPAPRASNAENVSIWWRHYETLFLENRQTRVLRFTCPW